MKSIKIIFLFAIVFSACKDKNSEDGDKLFHSGQYEKAITAYTDYLKYNPTHVKSFYNRGRAYEELDQSEKALDDFNKVIKLDPQNVNAYMSIGNHYMNKKDYKNAFYYFDLATQSSKERNALALYNRGKANHLLGNISEAMSDYNSALNVNENLGIAYLYRGMLKIHLKQNKQACSDFRIAKSLNTPNSEETISKYCK